MKSINRYLFLFVFILVLQGGVSAQTCKFKIMRGEDNLGSITAHKKVDGNKVTYDVTSTATFRVIFKYVRETFMDIVFVNGIMESSIMKQIMNKELKDHRITTRNGLGYDCIKNPGGEKFEINTVVRFCSSMLFFKEPKGQKKIFSESYQELSPIEEIEPGVYKLSLPEGKVNHYVYKKGKLEEIRVFRTVADLVFTREY